VPIPDKLPHLVGRASDRVGDLRERENGDIGIEYVISDGNPTHG
jgi:hypothetical protein